MPDCQLDQWSTEASCEPLIRVGLVLPSDGLQQATLGLPANGYRLRCDEQDARPCHGRVAVTLTADEGVAVDGRSCRRLRFEPVVDTPLAAGGGVRVEGVVAGRGFHWQHVIAPMHQGVVEVRGYSQGLLVLNELPLENYLTGVITAEMSGRCPIEFLKSQCVVARSWVLARSEPKHTEWPIHRCNDDCCQRFQGTTGLTERAAEAVRGTRGQVVADQAGRIIDANYSKSCGGIIERAENVWFVHKTGQRSAPDAPRGSAVERFFPVNDANLNEFLAGDWLAGTDVFCSPAVVPEADLPGYLGKVDDGGGHFRWRFEYTRAEVEQLLRAKYFAVRPQLEPLRELRGLKVVSRGDSGRISRLELEYIGESGGTCTHLIESEYNIRAALHEKFLYSSAMAIDVQRSTAGAVERIVLRGAGWGHGAGLCQIGALGMALRGYTCPDILSHYFEGVRIRACY